MIAFFVPWQVKQKQADRSRVVTTKTGKAFIHHYQSAEVKANAQALVTLCAKHRPEIPILGPVSLDLTVCIPWRKGDSKRLRAKGPAWADTKPDVDNTAKQMLDVLQSAGFFYNDSQVASLLIRKIRGGRCGVRVLIDECGPISVFEAFNTMLMEEFMGADEETP